MPSKPKDNAIKETSQNRRKSNAVVRAGQYAVYLLVLLVESGLRMVPLGICYRLGGLIGKLGYLLFPKYRKLGLHNLRIAFGDEKSEEERKKILKEAFKRLGANIVCGFKIPMMDPGKISSHVEVDGLEYFEKIKESNRGVVCCIPHMGNWELLTQDTKNVVPGIKQGTIYQALANPFLDAHVRKRRERLGYTLFDRSEGFYGPMSFLKDKGAVGVLVDQHAGDKGTWSPFFNRLASTTSLHTLVAKRTGAALLPLAVTTVGPARWKVVYGEEIGTSIGGEKVSTEALVTKTNEMIEELIRRSPEDWFWVHNRWKTPVGNFLHGNYKRGLALSDKYPLEGLQKFELLVRSPNWLGDACMALPAVRALSKGRPDIRITVLSPENLVPFWERVPEIDDIISKPKGASPKAVGALHPKGKATGFDVGVLFPNSVRSCLEAKALGARSIVGYEGHHRKRWIDQIIKKPTTVGPPVHQVVDFLRIVHQSGGSTDNVLEVPFLKSYREDNPPLKIALCPGAEYGPTKKFPAQRYAKVAKEICDQFPEVTWVIVGVKADQETAAVIEAQLGDRCENMVGKTSLSELIDLLINCRTLVSNDTGTMHLAGVLGLSTTSIFGSTEPILTGPIGNGHAIIRRHVSCSPCFLRECPRETEPMKCMTDIDDQKIIDAIIERL